MVRDLAVWLVGERLVFFFAGCMGCLTEGGGGVKGEVVAWMRRC